MAWKVLLVVATMLSLTECAPSPRPEHTKSLPSSARLVRISTTPSFVSHVSSPVVSSAPTSTLRPVLPSVSPKAPAMQPGRYLSRPIPSVNVIPSSESGHSVSTLSLPAGLICIETHESEGRYDIVSPYGDGGAFQYKASTWGGFGGYARAELAPPAMQDARALVDYLRGALVRHQLWPHTSRMCGV